MKGKKIQIVIMVVLIAAFWYIWKKPTIDASVRYSNYLFRSANGQTCLTAHYYFFQNGKLPETYDDIFAMKPHYWQRDLVGEYTLLSDTLALIKSTYKNQSCTAWISVLKDGELADTSFDDDRNNKNFAMIQNACAEFYRQNRSFPMEISEIESYLAEPSKDLRKMMDNCEFRNDEVLFQYSLYSFVDGWYYAQDVFLWQVSLKHNSLQ